jgi:hypothetical protein
LGRPWEDQMSQDDEAKRAIWARRAAERLVDGVVTASERLPLPDQAALLREIARRSLWHIPNSRDEVRELVRYFDIENLRQPHAGDDDVPEEPPRS